MNLPVYVFFFTGENAGSRHPVYAGTSSLLLVGTYHKATERREEVPRIGTTGENRFPLSGLKTRWRVTLPGAQEAQHD
jgi:hypothetical protein